MCKLQLEDIKNSNENIEFKDDYLELNGKDISLGNIEAAWEAKLHKNKAII